MARPAWHAAAAAADFQLPLSEGTSPPTALPCTPGPAAIADLSLSPTPALRVSPAPPPPPPPTCRPSAAPHLSCRLAGALQGSAGGGARHRLQRPRQDRWAPLLLPHTRMQARTFLPPSLSVLAAGVAGGLLPPPAFVSCRSTCHAGMTRSAAPAPVQLPPDSMHACRPGHPR